MKKQASFLQREMCFPVFQHQQSKHLRNRSNLSRSFFCISISIQTNNTICMKRTTQMSKRRVGRGRFKDAPVYKGSRGQEQAKLTKGFPIEIDHRLWVINRERSGRSG